MNHGRPGLWTVTFSSIAIFVFACSGDPLDDGASLDPSDIEVSEHALAAKCGSHPPEKYFDGLVNVPFVSNNYAAGCQRNSISIQIDDFIQESSGSPQAVPSGGQARRKWFEHFLAFAADDQGHSVGDLGRLDNQESCESLKFGAFAFRKVGGSWEFVDSTWRRGARWLSAPSSIAWGTKRRCQPESLNLRESLKLERAGDYRFAVTARKGNWLKTLEIFAVIPR